MRIFSLILVLATALAGQVFENKNSGPFSVTISRKGGNNLGAYEGLFFIAPVACEITSVRQRHEIAGTDGSAVTLMVKKVPSGTARASGSDVLAAGFDLKATVNTVQVGTLHGTKANYQLVAGDGLGLVPTGTLTNVDGVTVTVEFKMR